MSTSSAPKPSYAELAALVVRLSDALEQTRDELAKANARIADLEARLGLTSAVYKVEDGIISVLDMAVVFEFSRRATGASLPKHQGSECLS